MPAAAEHNVSKQHTPDEATHRERLLGLLKASPLPDSELLFNLGLYLNRQTLSRILLMQQLYQQIVHTHGVIMEFGVRWGQNLALFSTFRGMYEPYNYNRKIIGFDTFEGFPSTSAQDGSADFVQKGAYSVTAGYEDYLTEVLHIHQNESPIPHLPKFELVKGDATQTIDTYLKKHPETLIALAYFDFDLYEPTKYCLERVMQHVVKGGIIAFDELNFSKFPGETLAFKEVLGLQRYKLNRDPNNPLVSWVVVE